MIGAVRQTLAIIMVLLAGALLTTCGTRNTSEWPVRYQFQPVDRPVRSLSTAIVDGKPAVCSIHEFPGTRKNVQRSGNFSNQPTKLYFSRATSRTPSRHEWKSVKLSDWDDVATCRVIALKGVPVVVFERVTGGIYATIPDFTTRNKASSQKSNKLYSTTNKTTATFTMTLHKSGSYIFYGPYQYSDNVRHVQPIRLEINDNNELLSHKETPLRHDSRYVRKALVVNSASEVDPLFLLSYPRDRSEPGRYILAEPVVRRYR